eukprot:361128_1
METLFEDRDIANTTTWTSPGGTLPLPLMESPTLHQIKQRQEEMETARMMSFDVCSFVSPAVSFRDIPTSPPTIDRHRIAINIFNDRSKVIPNSLFLPNLVEEPTKHQQNVVEDQSHENRPVAGFLKPRLRSTRGPSNGFLLFHHQRESPTICFRHSLEEDADTPISKKQAQDKNASVPINMHQHRQLKRVLRRNRSFGPSAA